MNAKLKSNASLNIS